MKNKYKIINSISIIMIVSILLLNYKFNNQFKNNDIKNSYVSYSVDFNILNQYEINNQTYIIIEILNEKFIEDYKLKSSLITFKVDDQILNEIEIGKKSYYMGLLMKVEIKNEALDQELCSLHEQNSLFVISYPSCYQQVEVIGLFSYD
ncbi:MAG: hypothetical protein II005_10320 [Turicibacter sp.]|nr:hypothetical protein [Turicibacter sp.]MBQ8993586.1 hypothetical protein [Turicibacter sp.]MEE0880672.1 hypothetical protein [Turicibacter sp.]MEE1237799.1 hypothetical protein [Turicibacter sp.]